MNRRTMLRGVREIRREIELVAEFPGPDGGRVFEASDNLPRVRAREGGGAAGGIAPLVEWFADEIRDGGLMPEQRWNEPDAVLPLHAGEERSNGLIIVVIFKEGKNDVFDPAVMKSQFNRTSPYFTFVYSFYRNLMIRITY